MRVHNAARPRLPLASPLQHLLLLSLLLLSLMLSGCVLPLAENDGDRLAFIREHENLDADTVRALQLGKVIPGMTRELVEACWGTPSRVDLSEAIGVNLEWGVEVWEYRSDAVFTIHPEATVTFRNGRVMDVSPVYLRDLDN